MKVLTTNATVGDSSLAHRKPSGDDFGKVLRSRDRSATRAQASPAERPAPIADDGSATAQDEHATTGSIAEGAADSNVDKADDAPDRVEQSADDNAVDEPARDAAAAETPAAETADADVAAAEQSSQATVAEPEPTDDDAERADSDAASADDADADSSDAERVRTAQRPTTGEQARTATAAAAAAAAREGDGEADSSSPARSSTMAKPSDAPVVPTSAPPPPTQSTTAKAQPALATPHLPATAEPPAEPPTTAYNGRTRVVIGEGADRVALIVDVDRDSVRVRADTDSATLEDALSRGFGQLDQSLRRHGKQLRELAIGQRRARPQSTEDSDAAPAPRPSRTIIA